MFELEIDKKQGVAVIRYFEQLDDDELMKSITGLMESEDFEPHYCVVTDCRGADNQLSVNVVRNLAEKVCHVGTLQGKWGSIAATTRSTAIAMIFSQSVAGHLEHRVFSSVEGISEWMQKDLNQFFDE